MAIHDTARCEHARQVARATLQRFAAESTQHVNVECIAAQLGVRISVARLVGATAQLVAPQDGPAEILLSERERDPTIQRFNIAHELGHYLLQHPSPSFAEMCAPLAGGDATQERVVEVEANAFASEFLMPEPLVRPVCDARWASLVPASRIASMFGVSTPAGAIRFAELTTIPCAVVFSEDSLVRWTAPSVTFPWPIARGRSIDRRAIAWDYFSRGTLCAGVQLVPGAAWVDCASDVLLMEHSISVDDRGTVLTMLGIPSTAWTQRASDPAAASSTSSDSRSCCDLCP